MIAISTRRYVRGRSMAAAIAIAAAWWCRPISARRAYALASAIGLGSIVVLYGGGFVLGTSSYWDMPALIDNRMPVMGYRYFLHEPWHWPIFSVHTNMPYTRSIAFSDTPLLWALLHKAIATLVPPWRGFSANSILGLWYAVTTALQAAFGVACLRALGHKTWGATIVTSLFFLAIPAWTYRFPHASLYAHFVLLWALYLYLVTPSTTPAPRRLRVVQVAQLTVAALLNAYLTVMCLAVFAASLLRAPSRRSAALWFALACAAVGLALAFAGYFASEGATTTYGFSAAGSNLLGPVLPRMSGWFGNGLWVDVTGVQYEGVCYLGVGILVLTLSALLRGRELRAAFREHRALGMIAGVAMAFALSNHVYVGSHRILAYPIPAAAHWVTEQFRCPGRFSWLPIYVLVIFVLSRAFARFSSGPGSLFLVALAAAQLFDVTPDWRVWRTYTDGPTESPLDLSAWQELVSHVDEVDVFPAHDCNSDRSWELATEIEYLSSEVGVAINGVYTARPTRDCDADTRALLDFHPQPRKLYVFVAPMTALAGKLAAAGLPCATFSSGAVCSTDRALIDSLHWPTPPPPSPLGVGDAIDLKDPAGSYLELGWTSAEPDGRWTVGPISRLVFTPKGELPTSPQLWIEASAILCRQRTEEIVDVLVGGEAIGTLTFSADSNALTTARTLPLTRPELWQRPLVEIELRPRDFRSPHDVGCRNSAREIAVKVRRVSLESSVR